MSFANSLIAHLKAVFSTLIVPYVLVFILLLIIAIVSLQYDIPVADFTRDPVVSLGGQPFTGVLSNIGILFWCATSAICLFTSVIIAEIKTKKKNRFFFSSGLITSLLLLDDLFLFHETIFPRYLHLPDKLIYLGYIALLLAYFIKYRNKILQNEYSILVIACGFLGLSMVCDLVLPQKGAEFIIEDGFKIFGIVTWFIFFARTCLAQCTTTGTEGHLSPKVV